MNKWFGDVTASGPGSIASRGNIKYAQTSVVQYLGEGPAYILEDFLATPRRDMAWLREQPSRLLDARSQLVPFTARGAELLALTEWRDAAENRESLMLMHAPGGQGKTRLGIRFAELAQQSGWKVLNARNERPHGELVAASASLEAEHSGVLLIVDYADRWLQSDLLHLFSDPTLRHGTRLRVLLMARSVDWWQAIRGEIASIFQSSAVDMPLRAVEMGADSRLTAFSVARARFCESDIYGIDNPESVIAPRSFDLPDYGRFLTLHMAALVAVDAYTRGEQPPEHPHELSAYLLDRERAAWRRLYNSGTRDGNYLTPPAIMAKTVFVSVLAGPTSHSAGEKTLRGLGLDGHPQQILSDHRVCYPPDDRAMVLDPLYPDRLAEDFIALLLPGHDISGYAPDPWAEEAVVTLLKPEAGSPPAHVARALTFLASAAARWPHVGQGYVYPILRANPELALAGGSAVLTALAELEAGDASLSAELLAALMAVKDHVPGLSTADLDSGIAALTQRLADHQLLHTGNPQERSQIYHDLGFRLSNAGLAERALAATQEAAKIRRWLSAAEPGANTAALAASLNDLGRRLAAMGRWQDAVPVAKEASDIYRRLATVDRDTYMPALAMSLNNLAIDLSFVDRSQEGVAAAGEAVDIYRRFGPALEPALSLALNDYSVLLSQAGRFAEAAEIQREALERSQQINEISPAAQEPYRAIALLGMGTRLASGEQGTEIPAGQRREALSFTLEAVEIYRRLAIANPAAYEFRLSGALHRLAERLHDMGNSSDALEVAAEAVILNRRLSEDQPGPNADNLAASLWVYTDLLIEAGQVEKTRDVISEMIELCQRLEGVFPAKAANELAKLTVTCSARLRDMGESSDALHLAREAVDLYRQVDALQSFSYDSFRVAALDNLAVTLWDSGQWQEALSVFSEAIEILRKSSTARPGDREIAYLYAINLINYAVTNISAQERGVIDDLNDALTAAEHSATLLRRLSEADPVRFREAYMSVPAVVQEIRKRMQSGRQAGS